MADEGYDSEAIRYDLRDRGTTPEIPTKRKRKVRIFIRLPQVG